jgi:hypothetical protein
MLHPPVTVGVLPYNTSVKRVQAEGTFPQPSSHTCGISRRTPAHCAHCCTQHLQCPGGADMLLAGLEEMSFSPSKSLVARLGSHLPPGSWREQAQSEMVQRHQERTGRLIKDADRREARRDYWMKEPTKTRMTGGCNKWKRSCCCPQPSLA